MGPGLRRNDDAASAPDLVRRQSGRALAVDRVGDHQLEAERRERGVEVDRLEPGAGELADLAGDEIAERRGDRVRVLSDGRTTRVTY